MLIQCTECYKQEENLLDEGSDEVICIMCGSEIDVPKTTKKLLATLKQTQKHVPQALEFKCTKCGLTSRPVLKKAGATTVALCRECGTRSTISQYFVEALKMAKPEDADESAKGRKKPGAKPNLGTSNKVYALPAKSRPGSTDVPKKGT